MSKLKIKNANGEWESVAPSQKEFDNVKTQLADVANGTRSSINLLDGKKLDKTGIVTMANMGQDVKTAMTGGSVAVVGANAVLEDNLTDDLKDKLGFVIEEQSINFSVGSLSNGIVVNNTTRLVSNRLFLKKGTVLQSNSLVTDYAYTTYSSDDDNSFVLDSGWKGGVKTTLANDGYYRIVLRGVVNNNVDNPTEVINNFQLTGDLNLVALNTKERIEEIENRIPEEIGISNLNQDLISELGYSKKVNLSFELGSLSEGTKIASTSRIVSNRVYIPSGTTLSVVYPQTDYAYSYYTEDDDNSFVLDSSWKFGVKTTLENGGYYRIVLRDAVTNSAITDINKITSGFTLGVDSDYDKKTPNERITEIEGKLRNINISNTTPIVKNSLDAFVKAIMHRGYSTEAPENTLSTYKLAYEKGFSYIEADIRITSDGIPVLLHDRTINRTARNVDGSSITETLNIDEITLSTARQYDFGIWKDAKFAGEKIPTLEELLILCKKLNLHVYLDISAPISNVMDIVKKTGAKRHVTWCAWSAENINLITKSDSQARICYISEAFNETIISTITSLKISHPETDIFAYTYYANASTELVQLALSNDIPVEVWTWSNNANMVVPSVDKGISGICSDSLNIQQILLESEGYS